MFVQIEDSDHFQVLTKILGSGQTSPAETSFIVSDLNAGIATVENCFDTPVQTEILSMIDIDRTNVINDNHSNTLAFVNAYDSSDTIFDVINYDILNNSYSGFYNNKLAEIHVSLNTYRNTESTSEGSAVINCESDLSFSPLDNFISGFECQGITGSRRIEKLYDVRYRRSRIKI